MYKILYHPTVFKFFKKIAKKDLEILVGKIEKVAKDPFTTQNLDIKKLINTDLTYRLRHRNYRMLYQVDKEKKVIYLREIDFRGNVY